MSETNRMDGGHPPEEVLELYALGRLEEDRLGPVEEHLLVCEECRQAIEQAEEYARVMRAALEADKREAGVRSDAGFWRRKPVWAASVAVAAGLAFVALAPRVTSPPADVPLNAVRSNVGAAAPADRPLTLHPDRRGLSAPPYRVEIVDAEGKTVFQGTSEGDGERVTVRTNRKFPAGQYWVRFYSSTGELLREFGLRTE